jgi:hypothetical protein
MHTLEKLLLLASIAFAGFAAYAAINGLHEGVVCYQSRCAHKDTPGDPFFAYFLLYCGLVLLGLASAWRSYKNLKSEAHLKG